MRKIRYIFILLLPFLLFTSSCLEDEANKKRSLVNIYLIDAPGDFDQVWLEILRVEVFLEEGNNEGQEGWVPFDYIPLSNMVNVSALVAESQLILGRGELPFGRIGQIKMVLGDEHYLIKEEERIPLALAADLDSEIILDTQYDLRGGNSYDIYLDMDLSRSIRAAPNVEGNYLLNPVIRTFATGNEASISGRVTPIEARPFVHAILGEDTLTTLTNESGDFFFRGLQTGDYKIYFRPISPYLDSTTIVRTKIDSLSEMETILLRQP
ncbi:DUF4382 domain-containing protein [Echinicola marina]|uniref:DUF4382 domain-containing protein n=1 Tax=Echinicola marina TaxID=2859768 RepID=UPI001CF677F7|nr:DUF4382 domain-containing protein [Echinicola marina]UCS95715.1 DUF4382 domain-containing protein [Echinicola marina]